MNDCIFKDDIATNKGPCISGESTGPLTVTNSQFIGNSTSDIGGAINVGSATTPFIQGCTFTNNIAASGGAIYFTGTTTLTVDNCTFSGNSATNGGAIYSSGTLLVVQNNPSMSGGTGTTGAGIDIAGGSATVQDSSITGNTSTGVGGGISDAGTLTVSNTTISTNKGSTGGGINISGTGSVTLQNNTIISGNNATTGGGIDNGSSLTVLNSTISGNSATNGGGVVDNSGTGTTTVVDSIISGNTASSTGGGILSTKAVTLQNSIVSGNTAANGGGIYNNTAGVLTLDNATITKNNAGTSGGGIYDTKSTVYFVNSTLSGKSATTSGGGVFNTTTSTLTLLNGIIAGNTGATGPDIDNVGSTAAATYSLIGNTAASGIAAGAGNSLNPAFVGLGTLANYGGTTQTLPLLPGSPALESGAAVTQLAAAIADNVTTSLVVAKSTVFAAVSLPALPGGAPYFTIQIDSEQMNVVSSAGSTLTVVRGMNGTTAAPHSLNAPIFLVSDQRGMTAPYSNTALVDMGAFESQGFKVTLISGNNQTTSTSTAFTNPLVVSVTANNSSEPVVGGDIIYTGPASGASTNPAVILGSISFNGADGNDEASVTPTANASPGPFSDVASAEPTAAVTFSLDSIGPASVSNSLVTVNPAVIQAGSTSLVTLTAEDAVGQKITHGGLSVAFLLQGAGTSTGTFGPVTDNGNGTYTALFTGHIAGTATTVGATIGGVAVTSALPTITVIAGPVDLTKSTVAVNPAVILLNGTSTVTLTAVDSFGNKITGLTVAFGLGAGSSSGTYSAVTDNGDGTYTSTFTGTVGGTATTVTATIGGGSVTSALPTITVVARGLSFTGEPPASIVAGNLFSVTVQVVDQFGVAFAQAGLSVTLTPSAAVLFGTATNTTDAAGQVIFVGLSMQTTGVNTLKASGSPEGSGISSQFTITASTVIVLSYLSEPASTTAGSIIGPVTVAALDTYGNQVPGVVISIVSRPLALTSGSSPITTDATGAAVFSNLIQDTVGNNYTLTASSPTLVSIVSSPFNITAAAAAVLSFQSQPNNTTAGTTLNRVTVQVADKFGNVVSGTSIGIGINSGNLSTGTTPLTSNALGLVVFSNLSEDFVGTYTLIASSAGLNSVSSQPFTITAAAAASLTFISQPNSTMAGVTLNPVTVQAADQFGNPVVGASIGVSLSSGTLSAGTTPLTSNAAGQVVFNNLVEDFVGTYTLIAASGPLSVGSNPFFITAAAAANLSFVTQPMDTDADDPINPVIVQVVDSFNNPVTGTAIGIAISPGTLSHGTTLLTSDDTGQVSFNDLYENIAGTYTLTASAAGLSGITSNTFNIRPDQESGQVSFVTQPNSTTAGTTLNPVTVLFADEFNNPIAGTAIGISLVLPGVLSTGTPSLTTNSLGEVAFTDLSENVAGTYNLTASTAASSAVSNPFTITASAALAVLSFVSQPNNTIAGVALNPVTVQATDPFGNVVPGISIGIGIAPGTLNGGTTPLTANPAGQVVFNNLVENIAGTYNLTASSTGLLTVPSNPFTVSPAAAARLVYLSQPNSTTAGSTLNPVTLEAVDSFGNGVPSVSIGITLTNGFLSTGTTPLTSNPQGQAVFTDLSQDFVGTYTLTASSSGLTNLISSPFTITAGAAANIVFETQPNSVALNATLNPITVLVTDTFGNLVSGPVTMTVSSGTLNGTTTFTTNPSGLATFSNLSVPNGGLQTLTATSGSASATSNPFAVTDASDLLSFTTQPQNSTAGSSLGPVTVMLTDPNGVPLPGVTLYVTSSASTLNGTKTGVSNAAGPGDLQHADGQPCRQVHPVGTFDRHSRQAVESVHDRQRRPGQDDVPDAAGGHNGRHQAVPGCGASAGRLQQSGNRQHRRTEHQRGHADRRPQRHDQFRRPGNLHQLDNNHGGDLQDDRHGPGHERPVQ